MGFLKRNRPKDGVQGHFPAEGKHATTGHEISRGHGQSKDSEQLPPKVNLAPSPVLPNAEHVHRKQEKPESSMAREDQQTTGDRIEQENPNTICHVPQNAELTEGHQGPPFQTQKAVDASNESSQRRDADLVLVPTQDKMTVPDTTQSQPHDTGSIEARQRRRSHSQSTDESLDKAREQSPKKGRVRHRMKQKHREEIYAPSHKEKATSDRKRPGKESHEEKRRENSAYPQKQLLPQLPSSSPTQSRTDKPQSTPETPQARSELPLVRRDSFKPASGIPPKNSDPSHPGGGRDPGLTRGQVPAPAMGTIDPHAWERHLPQSADDATIQHKVLTLFEFIEHHVDAYYCDTRTKISQLPVQLAKLQSCYLPHGIPIEDLLVQAQYQGPVIKHCLINLVVSGMTADESPLFSLLPEEFTTLPRAIRKNRDEIEKRPRR